MMRKSISFILVWTMLLTAVFALPQTVNYAADNGAAGDSEELSLMEVEPGTVGEDYVNSVTVNGTPASPGDWKILTGDGITIYSYNYEVTTSAIWGDMTVDLNNVCVPGTTMSAVNNSENIFTIPTEYPTSEETKKNYPIVTDDNTSRSYTFGYYAVNDLEQETVYFETNIGGTGNERVMITLTMNFEIVPSDDRDDYVKSIKFNGKKFDITSTSGDEIHFSVTTSEESGEFSIEAGYMIDASSAPGYYQDLQNPNAPYAKNIGRSAHNGVTMFSYTIKDSGSIPLEFASAYRGTNGNENGLSSYAYIDIILDITFVEDISKYIQQININGSVGSPTEIDEYDSIVYNATTSQQSGTFSIKTGERTSPQLEGDYSAYSEFDIETVEVSGPAISGDMLTFTYSGLTSSAAIIIGIPNTSLMGQSALFETEIITLALTLTYVEPSSGGGGGGSTEVKINVINVENEDNVSSDTILTPNGTIEVNGKSTTTVLSAETDALIDLANVHAEDVEEGDHEAIIRIEDKGEGCTEYEVNLFEKDVEKITDSIIDIISVRTSIGEFRIRTDELASQYSGRSGKLRFKLFKIQHSSRPGVDAQLLIGSITVKEFNDSYKVEIRIPYEPAADEDTSGLFIEYIDEKGTTQTITESHYDAELKQLVFMAPHLSKYGVAYKPQLFRDVAASHWAQSYIIFLASRGVISGMGDGTFKPDNKVTKAQFISMMTRAFSKAAVGNNVIRSYKDVPADEWYAKAIGWSYMNNISTVISVNGYIYPNANLTREDMATLSNNITIGLALKLKNYKTNLNFTDKKDIVSYATSGVERMVSCGILAGSGGKFFPKSGLTRAEAAKVISTLLSGMK